MWPFNSSFQGVLVLFHALASAQDIILWQGTLEVCSLGADWKRLVFAEPPNLNQNELYQCIVQSNIVTLTVLSKGSTLHSENGYRCLSFTSICSSIKIHLCRMQGWDAFPFSRSSLFPSLSSCAQVWGRPCCEPSVCVLDLPSGD